MLPPSAVRRAMSAAADGERGVAQLMSFGTALQQAAGAGTGRPGGQA